MEKKVTIEAVGTDAATKAEPARQQLERSPLTLLAGSDLHGSRDGLDWFSAQAAALGPQLIVFLGDFITHGPVSFLVEVLRELRTLAPNGFVIPGNWDPREGLRSLDREAYDGLKHLHKQTTALGGYRFVGLGGSLPTPVRTTPLEMPEERLVEPLHQLLPADVWLLHNPLHGHRDRTSTGATVGSPALTQLWREQAEQPLLVLSGHIHEAYGTERDGATTFVNPGSLAERRAAWIQLDGDGVGVELLEG